MITRADIDERVRTWGVSELVVEKDYVLGWTLWGIGTQKELQDRWVFKGGTCLKKCFLETYRFSEDLDFTVVPGGPVEPDAVRPILLDALRRVGEESGIDFARQEPRFHLRPDGESAEIRIYYVGPRAAPGVTSIKADLSRKEAIAEPSVLRTISHPHADELPPPGQVRCYAFEELFAEKIRAMGDRCRPRDLYDVVNLFRRREFRDHPDLVRRVLVRKCEAKGLPVPTARAIHESPHAKELEAEWENMLGHQLPALPPIEEYLRDIDPLFTWLEGSAVPEESEAIPAGEGVVWSPPPTLWASGRGVPLESIRFAAINRLCINLSYDGSIRTIEPYSLRETRDNNILLYAVRVDSGEIRAYRIDKIEKVQVTSTPFRPRYRVEFSSAGGFDIPSKPSQPRMRTRLPKPVSLREYGVECGACGRRFRRKSYDTTIRAHKNRQGGACFGRFGRGVSR